VDGRAYKEENDRPSRCARYPRTIAGHHPSHRRSRSEKNNRRGNFQWGFPPLSWNTAAQKESFLRILMSEMRRIRGEGTSEVFSFSVPVLQQEGVRQGGRAQGSTPSPYTSRGAIRHDRRPAEAFGDRRVRALCESVISGGLKGFAMEILERLEMLCSVGLGYIALDRPSPRSRAANPRGSGSRLRSRAVSRTSFTYSTNRL